MKREPSESLCTRCFKYRCLKREFGDGPDEDCRPFDEVLYVKEERFENGLAMVGIAEEKT